MPTLFAVEGQVTPERLEEVAARAGRAAREPAHELPRREGPAGRAHSRQRAVRAADRRQRRAARRADGAVVQPFDLAVAPLWRVWHVRRSNGDELIALDIHHIIADGTSMGTLLGEVALYLQAATRSAAAHPRRRRRAVAAERRARDASSRRSARSGSSSSRRCRRRSSCRTTFARPRCAATTAVSRARSCRTAELDALAQLVARSRVDAVRDACSPAGSCSCRGSARSDDIIVGVPVSGRVHPDVQELVGMFVNTVPWRAQIPATGTFDRVPARDARDVAATCSRARSTSSRR